MTNEQTEPSFKACPVCYTPYSKKEIEKMHEYIYEIDEQNALASGEWNKDTLAITMNCHTCESTSVVAVERHIKIEVEFESIQFVDIPVATQTALDDGIYRTSERVIYVENGVIVENFAHTDENQLELTI